MQRDYRGHLIHIVEAAGWSAELIELETGTLLPTKACATSTEGAEVCATRAKDLVDLYLGAQADLDHRQRGASPPRARLRLIPR